MIVIIGASASGKTEISKILKNKYNIKKCITTTTRPIRKNEVNHVDYHFITKEEFETKIQNNEFIEYAIYNNNYYGINKKDIVNNSVVVVEPNGANALIKANLDNIFIVFIETNEQIRKQRMLDRGDNIKDIEKRLQLDKNIFKKENILRIDLILQNDNIDLNILAEQVFQKYQNCK